MPAGRPSSYKPEYAQQAAKLCDMGGTDKQIADFFEVSVSTLNLWKLKHEEFSEALKVGKAIADTRVEQSLYHKALGYSHEAVKIAVNAQGEVTQVPYIEHHPPDTTAAIFWLKNRKPAEWRDVTRQEHTGVDGEPIAVTTKDRAKAIAALLAKRKHERPE